MAESAAMARNFAEGDFNILYPRIDWGGAGPGYIEEAFQAYTWLVGLFYRALGVHESIGRAMSLVAFAGLAYLVMLFGTRLYGPRAGVLSVAAMIVFPMGLYFGTAFQPDMLAVFASVLGIYLFLIWTEGRSAVTLWASCVLITLSGLMKPVHLYVGLPLLFLALRRYGISAVWKPQLLVYAGVVLVAPLLYYDHAATLWERFGNTNGIGKLPWLYDRAHLTEPRFYLSMIGRTLERVPTWIGLPIATFGLVVKPARGNFVMHVWLAAFVLSILIVPGAHRAHDYYQLPLVPIFGIFTGAGLSWLWDQARDRRVPSAIGVTAGAIALLALAGLSLRVYEREYAVANMRIERELAFPTRLAQLTQPEDLVAIGTHIRRGSGPATAACCRRREPDGRFLGHRPVELYQSGRKGWSLHYEDWSVDLLDSLRLKGGEYFATSYLGGLEARPELAARLDSAFNLVERSDRWVIYRLSN